MRASKLGVMFLLAIGCGGGGGGADAGGSSAEEREEFDRGASDALGAQLTLSVADQLFDFDPTLDTTKTAEQNAQAIADNVRSNLQGCGMVQVSGAMVTVDFGSPPGCTLRNGLQVSGRIAVTVARMDTTLVVTLDLQNVSANGKTITGMVTFSTTNGTSFTVRGTVTNSGNTATLDLMVQGMMGAFTINGTVSGTMAGTPVTVTFTNVLYRKGSCYPEAGTVRIMRSRTSQTITFSAASAMTGSVTITTTPGNRTYPATLPAYGSCPATGGGGG